MTRFGVCWCWCFCRFLQLLGAHSLWILNRETVNRKRTKIHETNERTNRNETGKNDRTCMECLFLHFPRENETWTVEFLAERSRTSAARRNEKQKPFCQREIAKWGNRMSRKRVNEKSLLLCTVNYVALDNHNSFRFLLFSFASMPSPVRTTHKKLSSFVISFCSRWCYAMANRSTVYHVCGVY